MSAKTRTAFVLLLGTSLCILWLWTAGCDFKRVDEASAPPVADMLAALSNASTQVEAEAAIGEVLEETGVGVPSSPGPYEDLSALARSHLQFLDRKLRPQPSLGEAYKEVRGSGRSIVMEMSETLEILEEFANYALADPEEPTNLTLLVIATEGSVVPSFFPEQRPERVISPIQEFLFETWLRKHGPSMEEYATRKRRRSPQGSCPATPDICPNPKKNVAVCHKPGTPAEKTLCVPPQAARGHLGHGDRCGPCHDQGGGG